MMFAPDTAPFPIQDDIDIGEDGIGYALRMANANCITFNDLARRLASPGHLYLPATAASAIAFMFGGTPERIGHAFVSLCFREHDWIAHFFGKAFLRPYHLKQTRPQVCPMCMAEDMRTAAAWSVSLVTSCPRHGLKLLDHCICGRPVSWRRPTIDFCECGRRLAVPDQSPWPADPRELTISAQIMFLLGPAHFRLCPGGLLLPMFDDIAVDTFVRLLWAFGVVENESPADHPRCANRLLATAEASLLVCRAFDRLMLMFGARRSVEVARVAYSALKALSEDCVSPSDAKVVDGFIGRALVRAPPRSRRRVIQLARQSSLFEDRDEQ